jgi:hypothetical protein
MVWLPSRYGNSHRSRSSIRATSALVSFKFLHGHEPLTVQSEINIGYQNDVSSRFYEVAV